MIFFTYRFHLVCIKQNASTVSRKCRKTYNFQIGIYFRTIVHDFKCFTVQSGTFINMKPFCVHIGEKAGKRMNESRKRLGSLSRLILILYGCVVIYFVLFSDRLGRVDGYSTYRYNLVPFEEIRRFIIYRNYVSAGAFLLNLFGNLLVFFPIGFLVPIWRLEKTGCIRIIIYAFLFSLCIETLQLITKVGVFDVDDLMMNTAGGLIGWISYCIIRFIYHKWKAKNKKERRRLKDEK